LIEYSGLTGINMNMVIYDSQFYWWRKSEL